MGMIMIIVLVVVKIYLGLFCARHCINCLLLIIINPYNHLQSSFFFNFCFTDDGTGFRDEVII